MAPARAALHLERSSEAYDGQLLWTDCIGIVTALLDNSRFPSWGTPFVDDFALKHGDHSDLGSKIIVELDCLYGNVLVATVYMTLAEIRCMTCNGIIMSN